MTNKSEVKYWSTLIAAALFVITVVSLIWGGATKIQKNESKTEYTAQETKRIDKRMDDWVKTVDQRMTRMENNQLEILKRLPAR